MFIPWFGVLPFYANTFLMCCDKSKNILWVVHSDQVAPDFLPDNVKWYCVNNLTERINNLFDVCLVRENWGHKLCDLKPYWHLIFNEQDIQRTKFRGWCDWDVVHDLSCLDFNFQSAKFSRSFMCSPLFIQEAATALEYFPIHFKKILAAKNTCAWDEVGYLKNTHSTFMQDGMTPELDLFGSAKYAVHMYRAKHYPKLYDEWIQKYFSK